MTIWHPRFVMGKSEVRDIVPRASKQWVMRWLRPLRGREWACSCGGEEAREYRSWLLNWALEALEEEVVEEALRQGQVEERGRVRVLRVMSECEWRREWRRVLSEFLGFAKLGLWLKKVLLDGPGRCGECLPALPSHRMERGVYVRVHGRGARQREAMPIPMLEETRALSVAWEYLRGYR